MWQGRKRVELSLGLWLTCLMLPLRGQQGALPQPQQASTEPTSAAGKAQGAALLASNRLDAVGRPPFYSKLSLQLVDAEGAKAGAGTVEYWWAGARGAYLTVDTPTIHGAHATWLGAERSEADRRTLFLIDVLLRSAVDPGWVVDGAEGSLGAHTLTQASGDLRCLFRQPAPDTAYSNDFEQVCADAGGAIRLSVAPPMVVIRNRPAKAGATQTAEDLSVLVAGALALSGHVEALHSFDPAQSPVTLALPIAEAPAAAPGEPVLVAPFRTIGRKADGPVPIFPAAAKAAGQQGPVVLSVVVDQAGKVVSVAPLRGPSPELIRAAAEAVRLWSYQPFLQDGKPVAVTTLVPVVYSLR